jgi:AraC-like DNA-binding protein
MGRPDEDGGSNLPALPASSRARAEGSAMAREADRFHIHARLLPGLHAFMVAEGMSQCAIAQEMARCGLADIDATSFDGSMSMNRFARLLQRLAMVTGDEAAGLRIAEHAVPEALGVLGQVLATAPTMGSCFELLARYTKLYADTPFSSFDVGEERAEFAWSYSPLIVTIDPLCDRAARMLVLTIQQVFDPAWMPLEFHLQRRQPARLAPYRSLLAPVLRFDAPANVLVLRASDLGRVNRNADSHAHEIALELARRMAGERRMPDDLLIQVREDILANLAGTGPNIGATARRLGMSTRVLQRRLEEASTGFHAMAEDLRLTLTHELLTQTSLPMSEIAYRMGFANQANLTRAVRRWFDATPKDVRHAGQG